MKQYYLAALLILPSFTSAQEVINSNNTNYNNTNQEISNISNDIYNNNQQDSSVSTVNNIDNSLGNLRNNPVHSNNVSDSNNQWNQTNQEITNNNIRTVSGTNESFNGTQTGDITNDVDSKSTSTSGAASNSGALSGSSSGSNSGASSTSGSSNVSISNDVPRQAPMAWAPNMAMSFSQFNCNNSAAVGASSPFGGLSVGVPITGDDCVRFWDTVMWMNLQQNRIACYRMLQHEGNQDAMRAAGLTCDALTTQQVGAVPDYTKNYPSPTYWEKQEEILDNRLNELHHTYQLK